MLIAALGSAGLGLTWGWLVATLGARARLPVRTVFRLVVATLLLTGQVWTLVGRDALPTFLGATGLALLLHLAWRRELLDRFGPNR